MNKKFLSYFLPIFLCTCSFSQNSSIDIAHAIKTVDSVMSVCIVKYSSNNQRIIQGSSTAFGRYRGKAIVDENTKDVCCLEIYTFILDTLVIVANRNIPIAIKEKTDFIYIINNSYFEKTGKDINGE